MTHEIAEITLTSLCNLWGIEETPEMVDLYREIDSRYVEVSEDERTELIAHVRTVLDGELVAAGESRAADWEKGWFENLELFRNSNQTEDLRPRYFGKIPQIRWMSKWITPKNPNLEYQLFGFLLDSIVIKYMKEAKDIYEFGCGTGHNLLRIRKLNKNANLIGLDWADSSQKLVKEVAIKTKDSKLTAENFDYFNPNLKLKLADNSTVVTIASLEQTGTNFRRFIDYLMSQGCGLVIHIEPIGELLDVNNEIDSLSIQYFKKRNYLNGLLDYLKQKETEGHLKIIDARRSRIGSFYIEGYSIIAWKPTI